MIDFSNITQVGKFEGVKAGWYFNIGRKEFFVISNQEKKTKKFVEKILKALLLPINPDTIKELSYYMMRGNIEIKHCEGCKELNTQAKDYYNIFGKNFS